jgi:hypothetical protein
MLAVESASVLCSRVRALGHDTYVHGRDVSALTVQSSVHAYIYIYIYIGPINIIVSHVFGDSVTSEQSYGWTLCDRISSPRVGLRI